MEVRGKASKRASSRGACIAPEFVSDERSQFLEGWRAGHRWHDTGHRAVLPLGVCNADDGDVSDPGVLLQQLFDRCRPDHLAARDDHVIAAPEDRESARLVEFAEVTGRKEPPGVLRIPPVAVGAQQHRAAEEDLAVTGDLDL